MSEVEGTIYDGDLIVVDGTTVLLDGVDESAAMPDGSGWHAHVALPLDMVLELGVPMRLELADGRSGSVTALDAPIVEGDRLLYELTGDGPLAR